MHSRISSKAKSNWWQFTLAQCSTLEKSRFGCVSASMCSFILPPFIISDFFIPIFFFIFEWIGVWIEWMKSKFKYQCGRLRCHHYHTVAVTTLTIIRQCYALPSSEPSFINNIQDKKNPHKEPGKTEISSTSLFLTKVTIIAFKTSTSFLYLPFTHLN